MESIENMPGASKYIEPGQGWNGKVYSPARKEAMIKKIDYSNLPLGQSIKLKQQIRETGVIPDMTPIPNQPGKWMPRNKDKPKY
jgi:hypothetical protein